MKNFLLLSLFIAIGLASAQAPGDTTSINPPNCGQRPFGGLSNDKVVGGVEAVKGDWGWQVAMKYNNGFTCGGSVLNSQWIITGDYL